MRTFDSRYSAELNEPLLQALCSSPPLQSANMLVTQTWCEAASTLPTPACQLGCLNGFVLESSLHGSLKIGLGTLQLSKVLSRDPSLLKFRNLGRLNLMQALLLLHQIVPRLCAVLEVDTNGLVDGCMHARGQRDEQRQTVANEKETMLRTHLEPCLALAFSLLDVGVDLIAKIGVVCHQGLFFA